MDTRIKDITNSKNLVFTSAGDNTNFDKLWTEKKRNYDIWVVYYGDNEEIFKRYKSKVDFIEKRKGSKFQNFYYIYNNYKDQINKYERFFILDDDIIISTKDINKMFKIAEELDLWICQPSFDKKSKISYGLTRHRPLFSIRFTNFVEVNSPLFSKHALDNLMKYYNPILIGWGIDSLAIWANGLEHKRKYAVINSISCTNPFDEIKEEREVAKINGFDKSEETWLKFKDKLGIKEWGMRKYTKTHDYCLYIFGRIISVKPFFLILKAINQIIKL